MKATKKEMKAEALERMRQLGLRDSTIQSFEAAGTVVFSEQVFIGRSEDRDDGSDAVTPYGDGQLCAWQGLVHALCAVAADEPGLRLIENVEKSYNVLVYHVIRTEGKMGTAYALLYVEDDREDWDSSQNASQRGMPNAYVTLFGDPTFEDVECGTIFVKPVDGCLLRTN